MANEPERSGAGADIEAPVVAPKSKSLWQIVRLPIGIVLLGLYLFGKIAQKRYPPTFGYNNAAQAGGGSIAGVLMIWLIFYIFISRKNGVLLNLAGPIFAVASMWMITDYL